MDINKEQLNQIDDINHQIKKYNSTNRIKKLLLKKYKLNLSLIKTIPYVITTGLIAGTFSLIGYTPFLVDRKKEYLNTKRMIDSEGNIRIEEFYDSKNDNLFNTIAYVSSWTKKGDMYERHITTYDAHVYNEEELIRFINEEEDNLPINKLFKKVISKTKEQANELSDEELNKEGYLLAILYDEDYGEFRYIRETSTTNSVSSATIIAIIIAANFMVYNVFSGNDMGERYYQNRLEKLEDKYPNIDIDELKRKLEIRKENYRRLNR